MSIKEKQRELIEEFSQVKSWEEKYKKIIDMGKALPKIDEELYDEKYLVKGCQSQVWLHAEMSSDGQVVLKADSDAMIVKGLVALLLRVYSNQTPGDILETPPDFMKELGLDSHLSPSRANGFASMIKQIMMYAFAFQKLQQK